MTNTGITTLGQVAEKVHSMAVNHHDQNIRVADITFDSIDTIRIAGEPHKLREQAGRQISQRLRVPYSYMVRCDEDLQSLNLNRWIENEAKKRSELFFRFDGEDVRACFTDRYRPLDNHVLIDHLFDMGYEPDTKLTARLDSEFMSVNIMNSDLSFDVNGNGDKILQGFGISNSEVGLSAVSVMAMAFRLICENGLLGKIAASTSKRHISSDILESFPEMIHQASIELSQQRDQFRISLDTKVHDVDSTLETLGRQFQLSEEERDASSWGFQHDPQPTMFHVIQGYAKAPQWPNLSAQSCNKLERVSGQILSMVKTNDNQAAA